MQDHDHQPLKQQGWEPFLGKLWQRHIIRSECDILRQYTLTNPARWESDTFYAGSTTLNGGWGFLN